MFVCSWLTAPGVTVSRSSPVAADGVFSLPHGWVVLHRVSAPHLLSWTLSPSSLLSLSTLQSPWSAVKLREFTVCECDMQNPQGMVFIACPSPLPANGLRSFNTLWSQVLVSVKQAKCSWERGHCKHHLPDSVTCPAVTAASRKLTGRCHQHDCLPVAYQTEPN